MQEEVNKQLDMMLENDIIQPSTSPWASGIVLFKKKDDTKRFCIDNRRVNDVIVKDAYVSFTENRKITGPACWLEVVFMSRLKCRLLAREG